MASLKDKLERLKNRKREAEPKADRQGPELRLLGEAGLAMLLTVGAVGAIIVIVACTVLSAPWWAGIAVLAAAWGLFTWDFYSAELESRHQRMDAPKTAKPEEKPARS